jgi:Prokaryotic N-terminal methylation motif
MRARGFSLLEALITLFIGTVVMLAVGSFYVQTVRAWSQGQTQADLRRLAGLVQQEMGRIIGPAVGLPPGTCGLGGVTTSLPVQIPAGVLPDDQLGHLGIPPLDRGGYVCFYRDPGTDALMRCRLAALSASGSAPCVAGSEANLLTGVPIVDPIRLTDLPANPDSGLRIVRTAGTSVHITFNLGVFDTQDGAIKAGPMTFATRFTVRN